MNILKVEIEICLLVNVMFIFSAEYCSRTLFNTTVPRLHHSSYLLIRGELYREYCMTMLTGIKNYNNFRFQTHLGNLLRSTQDV